MNDDFYDTANYRTLAELRQLVAADRQIDDNEIVEVIDYDDYPVIEDGGYHDY